MRDTLPSKLGLDPELYVPLRLGSTVIGWTPSVSSMLENRPKKRVAKVIIGDRIEEIDFHLLWEYLPDELAKPVSEFEVNRMMRYGGDIILNLPVGSIDVDDFTPLFVTMVDWFRVQYSYIQAALHQHSPEEVMKIVRTLMNNSYYWEWDEGDAGFSWRGQLINNLIKASHMKFCWRTQKNPNFNRVKETSLSLQLVSDMPRFDMLMFYQLQNSAPDKDFAPQYTFFIKATSEEEQKMSEKLFQEGHLDMMLQEAGHKVDSDYSHSSTFFFGQSDDPLVEWIRGTHISTTALCNVAKRYGFL